MLGKNTNILMSNLKYKNIKDIIIGDLIRTINKSFAKVIFIYSGINRIYDIITDKFGIYQVTSNQKLALFENNNYVTYTVAELLNSKQEFHQGYILSSDHPIIYNFSIRLNKIDIYYGFNLNTSDSRIVIDKSIITYSK